MIKIIYEQPAYNYENVGAQNYDIHTEITLDKDITSIDAILAFMKLLQIATYRVSGNILRDAAEEWDAEN